MNKRLILSLLGMSLFSTINNNLILEAEADNISKNQEDLSPLITYTTEQIGDREKMRVTVTVEDRSGSGIKEFRDYNNKIINGNSYTFEINKRGDYRFSVIDNNNLKSAIQIDDLWINPYSSGVEGRKLHGSGYWSSSNLREWLNSDSLNVDYTSNPPSKEYIDYAYDKESGFLYQFTDEEKDAIAVTQRRVLLDAMDKKASDINFNNSLTHINMYSPTFLANLKNYIFDYKNFGYKSELDKVFILNPTEIYWYLEQRGISLNKEFTDEIKKKYNIKGDNYGWWTQWSSRWDNYDRKLITKRDDYVFSQVNSMTRAGVVPALHIKPNYTFNDGKKAKDLNIMDKITFGRYMDSPIIWTVVNISDNGYPLLLSDKMIEFFNFDAKGDQSRIYSDYINYKKHDVSTLDDLQFKSTYNTEDIMPPKIRILNEEALNIRQNGSFELELEFYDDDSEIEFVITPEGNKIYSSSLTYQVSSNGYKIFTVKDTSGNYSKCLIPSFNINQSPEIKITTSTTTDTWTNNNINLDIHTSNEVVWKPSSLRVTNNKSLPQYGFPNYTVYNDTRFKISGKAKLLYKDESVKDSDSFKIGTFFNNKSTSEYGYIVSGIHDYNNHIYIGDLNYDTYTEFEFNYIVPSNYSHGLKSFGRFNIGNGGTDLIEIEIIDLSYELVNSDTTDFFISSIVLPNGEIINDSNYTTVISEEGINNYTFKIIDSRGKETSKTITTKIDKTAPTLNLNYNTNITNQNISVNISASDATSGVKRIKLPNGNYITNSNSTYTISGDGEYTFECEDIAENIITKTITINNIDKEKPSVVIDKNNTDWTNKGVQININTRD